MPLNLTAHNDHQLCHGHSWEVVDETLLINLLTRLITGYHRHVSKILRDPKLPLSGNAHSLDALIKKLGPPTSDATRYHRDGWVFQMISWIAAHKASNACILIAPPQPRPADKGFDGRVFLNNSPHAALTSGRTTSPRYGRKFSIEESLPS